MKGSDESSDKHEEKIIPELFCPAVKAGSGWVQCLITYHQTDFLLKCFTAGWSTPGAPSLRGQRMTRRWLSRCGNWLIFSSLSLTFLDVNKNLNPGKGSHHRIPATKVSSLFLPCSGPQQWPRHITRRLWRWVHYWIPPTNPVWSAGLNSRVRHYMAWGVNSPQYLTLREVHDHFISYFLLTSLKFVKVAIII